MSDNEEGTAKGEAMDPPHRKETIFGLFRNRVLRHDRYAKSLGHGPLDCFRASQLHSDLDLYLLIPQPLLGNLPGGRPGLTQDECLLVQIGYLNFFLLARGCFGERMRTSSSSR